MISREPARTAVRDTRSPASPAIPKMRAAPVPVRMSAAQREAFERDGYIVLPGVLSQAELVRYTTAIDDVYARAARLGELAKDGSLHRLSAVTACPELADLMTHPAAFPLVWQTLGWNVHVYHSHLDVHPTVPAGKPFRFEWHQDGGRQNREIETDPRPRLSVKLAFWLSDVSQPGRGNFKVVPGSHLANRIDGPPRRDVRWPDPEGAIQVCVDAGDAVFFDRRIWHARSDNHSPVTRKAAFFGYTNRWIIRRDQAPADPAVLAALTPVQRQLLGVLGGRADDAVDGGDHAWGHFPDEVPLYGYLKENGLLDPDFPPLKP